MNAALVAGWPWIEALGWTLLHFVWQGLLIGAGFAAARALLAKERCDARYATGLAALALLAICPALTFFALLHQQMLEAAAAGAASFGAQGRIGAAIASLDSGLPGGIDGYLPWLVLVWVVGVLCMACRALYQWRVLAHIARHHAVPSIELELVLDGLARRFRFVRQIRVLMSARIDTPTLIGWLKPVILLPTAVALGFPRQQIELILAHELGHLRRYDHLVNLAQALLETLLFYHPVVHWISGEVRNEREICCDALVLRLTSGEPREYARTLAALEDLRQQPPARIALAASGGVLLDRVRRIIGMPTPGLTAARPNAGLWLLIAAGLTVAVASVLRVSHDDDTRMTMPSLAIDWLPRTQLRALPMLALSLPRYRPHLELAAIAPQSAPPVASINPGPPPAANAGSVSARIGTVESVVPPIVAPANPAPASRADSAREPGGNALPGTLAKIPSAQTTAAPIATDAVSVRPAATHIITPEYPEFARGGGTEHVEVSFAIDVDGSVRDIAVTNSGFDGTFARAAERALRQWRFDPSTVSAGRLVRYTQTFVFAPGGKRNSATRDEQGCVQPTGSHICRRVGELR